MINCLAQGGQHERARGENTPSVLLSRFWEFAMDVIVIALTLPQLDLERSVAELWSF